MRFLNDRTLAWRRTDGTDSAVYVSGALAELARPEAALEDASTWTSHVGIVSAEPSYIERRQVRESGYHQDFLSGPRSIEEALSTLRDHGVGA